ncbi:VanZ family protein [Plantactinospora siamensis]|uniref:VanZ family protein n=1 Tax=Plantactinospora siamensis TaxID=555372 RepID=A0ABV6NSC1_9ACTN
MGWVWAGAVVVSILGVLGAGLAAAAGYRLRRRCGMPAGTARRFSAAEFGMVAGTLPWLWLTLTPRPHARLVHLIPLSDLVDQVRTMPAGWVAEQAVGNLLVFAALGFCAPIRYAALARFGRILLLGAAASAVIEILQYALDIGRVSSVDDVLLNASGAALAGLLSRRWWATRPGESGRTGGAGRAGSPPAPAVVPGPGSRTTPPDR